MDNRDVVVTVIVEHPDCEEPINAQTTIPANEFGPDVMRHMMESLYGAIKSQALRRSPIIMPKRSRIIQ